MLDEDNAVVKEHFSLALHPVMLDARVESKIVYLNLLPLCTTMQSGAEGDRTPDLLNANQALSQLSYCPDCD